MPFKELIQLRSLQRILGVVLIIDDFCSVDEAEYVRRSRHQSAVLPESALSLENAVPLLHQEPLALLLLFEDRYVMTFLDRDVSKVSESLNRDFVD